MALKIYRPIRHITYNLLHGQKCGVISWHTKNDRFKIFLNFIKLDLPPYFHHSNNDETDCISLNE